LVRGLDDRLRGWATKADGQIDPLGLRYYVTKLQVDEPLVDGLLTPDAGPMARDCGLCGTFLMGRSALGLMRAKDKFSH
jgi:hypothetical protein